MLSNYFKIAIRNLWRNKAFSAINILGLAIGIATCLVIMLFVVNEWSYDRYNEKADRIVRVVFRGDMQGGKINESTVMPPTAAALKAEFAEIQQATRLRDYGRPRLLYGDKTFRDDAFAFVDPNFFDVFTLPLIEGNAKTALSEPNSVVISKQVATKYFGKENPIGKIIRFKDGNNPACKVTGLIDKVPGNSHFHFDLFGSMSSLGDATSPSWMTSGFFTYLLLPKGLDYKKLEAKLPQVVDKYIGPQFMQAMGVSLTEYKQKGNSIGLYLEPLTDIHLRSNFAYDLSAAGDIRYVYIFLAIAIFMLMIACINFMNLSTAGASKRAREVGIRKVMGSLKNQLVGQFLLESIVITAIALVIGILLVQLALPTFNSLSGKQLTLSFSDHPILILLLVLFALLVGTLAGSYPAFYLSSFRPVAVLKGKITAGKNSISLRSGLVVFQFFISITLIVCTTVVYKQLGYIQNKKLGYDKEQVLILPPTWQLGNKSGFFQQQLLNDPRIISASKSSYLPAGPSYNNNFFIYPGDNSAQMVKTLRYEVDDQYIPTLGMEMKTGRNFSKEFGTDSSAIILNEAAVKAFGWEKNAIGQTLTHGNNEGKRIVYSVIGVVKDFHFKSLHELITPLVMTYNKYDGNLILKTKTSDIAGLTSTLASRWNALEPQEPFEYSFLDERYNQVYTSEEKTGTILGIFAALTIFVACMGLFGLAKFTAEQRTKEIGIRKVLGATTISIVNSMSKNFLKLVVIGLILSCPIAWYAMHKWLEDFAYRINISGWIFVIAAVIAILLTIATVSLQAIKAALANPVKSLRSE